MISERRRYQFPPTTPAYRGTPYVGVISTIFYSGFLAARHLIKRTNRVNADAGR